MKVITDAITAIDRLKVLIYHHKMTQCYQVVDDVISWLDSLSGELRHKSQVEDLASRLFLDLEGQADVLEKRVKKMGKKGLRISGETLKKLAPPQTNKKGFLVKADPKALAAKGIKTLDPDDMAALDSENQKILTGGFAVLLDKPKKKKGKNKK